MGLFKPLIMMYFLFPFYLKGLYMLQAGFIYSFSLAVIGYHCFLKNVKFSKKNSSLIIFPSMFFLILVVIVSIFSAKGDLSYINVQIVGFVKQLLLCLTPFLLFSGDIKGSYQNKIENLMLLFIKSVACYVFFSVILLIPNFREIWLKLVFFPDQTSKELVESLSYYTRFGLQGFSGFRHALLCSLSFIFLTYLYFIGKFDFRKGTISKNLVIVILIVFGALIYGRIAIVSVLLASFLFVLFSLAFRNKLVFSSFIIFFSLTSILLVYLFRDDLANIHAIYWILEPLLNFFSTGELRSNSTDHLSTMYFFPNESTLLYGDGFYTNPDGSYYMHTDVGFLRTVLFGGIVLLFSYYLTFIGVLMILLINKTMKGLFIVSQLLCFILLVEVKGEAMIHILPILIVCLYLVPSIFTKREVLNVT